jgi:hypothetical protein
MFPYDDSPEHVTLTPRANERLAALAAGHGAIVVVLAEDGVHLLPAGESAPDGAVKLGDVPAATIVAASGPHDAQWWRTRATLDVTDSDDVSVELSALSEPELYEALAAGPLPRL